MTASRMDQFVRHLFEVEDFRSLTMRTIREKYEEEAGVELNAEQKNLLKEKVEILFSEKMKEIEKMTDESDNSSEILESSTTNKKRKKKQINTSEDSDDGNYPSPMKKKPKITSQDTSNQKGISGSNDHRLNIDIEINKKTMKFPKKETERKKSKPVTSKASNRMIESDNSSDISDDDVNGKGHELLNPQEGGIRKKLNKQKTFKNTKTSSKAKNMNRQDEKSNQLKYYEKIARTCGVMPVGARYKATFKDCTSESDRLEKLKHILREAGMTGRISMEEAEKLKLKREAAELGTDNIIICEGRSRRNVFSVYSSHENAPSAKGGPENQLTRKHVIDSDSE